MLVPLVSSAETSLNALCHRPAGSRMTESRSTGHPPQHQARPPWHVFLKRSERGTCAPSAGDLLPSLRAAFRSDSLFACRALTANWTHLKMESPSTTTSRRRVSCTSGRAKSMSRTMMLLLTLPPTFSAANPPPPQNPNTSTNCAVVATGIEWKATLAVAPGQREVKAKTTKDKDSGQVRFQTGDATQQACGQS